MERAEALLQRSVELAQEQHILSSLALGYNTLGTLALRRRDVGPAVDAFDKSVGALVRNNELFRTAQVYNNLGLAYADVLDWERSYEYFRKSLEIKSKARHARAGLVPEQLGPGAGGPGHAHSMSAFVGDLLRVCNR